MQKAIGMDAYSLPSPGAELISVRIRDQQFAIDIMQVREIRGWTTSTPLPHAPAQLLGMINLRGVMLPVLDLAAHLGMGPNTPVASSVVVVVQCGEQQIGLMVDAVCDILILGQDQLQPPPDIGATRMAEFVAGVMSVDNGIVSLLCLENLLPLTAVVAEAA